MYRNYGEMISYQKAFEIPLPPEPIRDTGFKIFLSKSFGNSVYTSECLLRVTYCSFGETLTPCHEKVKTECVAGHGNRTEFAVVVEDQRFLAFGCTEHVEQRKEMLRGRCGITGVRYVFVCDDAVILAIPDIFCDCLIKCKALRRSVGVIPFHKAKIVDNVSACQDQISLVPKRR